MLLVLVNFYYFFFVFFFFQAEDGIRDGTVTGVQTCALPISREESDSRVILPFSRTPLASRLRYSRQQQRRRHGRKSNRMTRLGCTRGRSRSEERRVGKECRSRWSPDHEKKKTRVIK